MPKYMLRIAEVSLHTAVVEAGSEDEAWQKTEEEWDIWKDVSPNVAATETIEIEEGREADYYDDYGKLWADLKENIG